MATTTKKRATKKGATTKSATTKATSKAKKSAESDGPSKRDLQRAENAKLRERVVEMRDSETSWGEIASELSITPGKAQFLMMQHCVETGEVKAIRHTNEDQLVAGIVKAREANDAHSSWGWIAARTGVSEGKVKALAEEAGLSVKGSNVAVARAEANGGGKKADTKTRKQATTKSSGKKGTSKTTAARKRAAKKAGQSADPS